MGTRSSHLVDDCTSRKGGDILRTCLNDRSHGIKDNRDNDQLHSAEDICNLRRGGLRSGRNHRSENIDRSQQAVLAVALGSIRLGNMLAAVLMMSA